MGVIRAAFIAVISVALRAAIHRIWQMSVGWGEMRGDTSKTLAIFLASHYPFLHTEGGSD